MNHGSPGNGAVRDTVKTETLAFLLVPNFSMIAFSGALEALRLANRAAEAPLYRWILLSRDGGAVRASNGTTVQPDLAMRDLPLNTSPPPTIVVCSGLGVERWDDRTVYAWLRRCDRHGAEIGALCTGTYVLARAGLITDHRCTIHWEDLPGFTEAFPNIDVSADLFEFDRNRFTCSGGMAALDMMLYRIASQHGEAFAAKVSELCVTDRIRGPRERQRMPIRLRLGVHHPKLIAAIELMEANVEEPLPHDMLAKYVGLSRRQLERLFRKHLRCTPSKYYLELRLERARQLLRQTNLPITDVACACGFVSAAHFSNSYRKTYGRSPRQERIRAAN